MRKQSFTSSIILLLYNCQINAKHESQVPTTQKYNKRNGYRAMSWKPLRTDYGGEGIETCYVRKMAKHFAKCESCPASFWEHRWLAEP